MDVNVFELAFKENAALATEPVKPSKKVVESVARKVAKMAEAKPVKEAVQLGKIRFTEDTDEISSVQPDEDIVVVYSDDIKPDMTEEEVEQAAQELIGATICKCGVCGANYIATEEHTHDDEIVLDDAAEEEIPDEFTFTDDEEETLDDIEFADEELGESLLFREAVEDEDSIEDEEVVAAPAHICPVCDAAENQVEVGEIVPTEVATEEEPTEEVEETPVEDEIPAEDVTADEETEEAPVTVDVDVNVQAADDDEDAELSKEALDAVKAPRVKRHVKAESKVARKAVPVVEAAKETKEIAFNEKAFSRLLNKFVAENYENVAKVEITSGKATKNNELCFEGKVTAKSGKVRKVTFETLGFKYTEGLMKIKMIEKGPFTESARVQKNAVPFVLECRAREGRVMPTAFKCRYAVKMQNEWFECCGKYTLSEVKTPKNELFGLGKKKKSSTAASSKDTTDDVERKVSITIYDENGTKQFAGNFTELPGKMSAEDQLKNQIKDSYPSLLKQYNSSSNRSDWSYVRTSNPASGLDTKRGRLTSIL